MLRTVTRTTARGCPRLVSVAAMATLAVLATACTSLTVTQRQQYRAEAEGVERGGRLVVAMTAPDSLDPVYASNPSAVLISSLVCEPLVQLDPTTGELAHGLVATTAHLANGAAFTLSLREDVRFHDGSTMSAQDVVYALSRAARHDIAAPRADLLSSLVGFSELHAPPAPDDDRDPTKRTLAGVRPISRDAVEVTLATANAEILKALAAPISAPVPNRAAEKRSFGDKPVCAGPYELTNPYRPGDERIELRRFEDYYGKNDAYPGGGRGYADVIEVRIVADRATGLAAFERGEVDLALVPPDRLRGLRARGVEVHSGPAPSVELLAVGPVDGPFGSPQVRALLSAALDRTRIVDEVFGGGRVAADRFYPPSAGELPKPPACAAAVPAGGGPLNPAAVEAIRGTPATLYVNPDFQNRQLADAAAQQWREKLGLVVQVVDKPWDDYVREITSPRGIDGLFRFSWTLPYASPDAVVGPLFHSSRIGTTNVARYNSRVLDRLLDRRARRATDGAERQRHFVALEAALCQELPLIPVTFGQEELVLRSERVGLVAGGLFDRTTGLPNLREIWIKEVRR